MSAAERLSRLRPVIEREAIERPYYGTRLRRVQLHDTTCARPHFTTAKKRPGKDGVHPFKTWFQRPPPSHQDLALWLTAGPRRCRPCRFLGFVRRQSFDLMFKRGPA